MKPKSRGHFRNGVVRVLALTTPITGLMAACSGTEAPAKGQLMVALQTDMAVPQGFDRIRVQILVRGDLRHDGTYTVAPDGSTKLPATLAVVAGTEKAPPVEVRVIGIAGRQAQTFSKVITTVPPSRIATLHVPLQWLCQGQVVQEGSGPDAVYESSCTPTGADGEVERSCSAGKCEPVVVDEEDLPTFDPTKVFGGGRRPGDPSGQCFDVQGCFRAGFDVTPDASCRVAVDAPDGRNVNFAVQLPPGDAGICDENDESAPCYVPLDKSDRLGWRELSGGRAQLPTAVCDRLASNPALGVRMTYACDAKTEELPTCGPWSAAPTAGVPVPVEGTGGGGGMSGAGTGAESGSSGEEGGAAGAPAGDLRPNADWSADILAQVEDLRAASGCSDRAQQTAHTTDSAAEIAAALLADGNDPEAFLTILSSNGVPGAASYYTGLTGTAPVIPENAFGDYFFAFPCDPTSLGVAVTGAPGEQRAFAVVIANCQSCGASCQLQCSDDGSGGSGGMSGGKGGSASAGRAASGGSGNMVCADGLTFCAPNGCVDTDSSAANCGECDSPCLAGQLCSAGMCLGGVGGTGGIGGTGGQGGESSPPVDCGEEVFPGAPCTGTGMCPSNPSCFCDDTDMVSCP